MNDVLYERAGAVATITLNRPERMNTISHPMLLALSEALLQAGRDAEVRAVIITGAGRAFCGGLDLTDAASDEGVRKGGFALAPTLDLREFPPVVLHQLDKPVVCAINGGAAGFGIDLTLGADVRVCASHAKLAITFTRRGVMPETGGTWYLPRLLGWSKAAELILAGRTLSAAEALELGLVSQVVEAEELLRHGSRQRTDCPGNAPSLARAVRLCSRADSPDDDDRPGFAARFQQRRNTGSVTESACRSKPTCTGIPISSSPGAQSTTLLRMRTPSSSSTMTAAYGVAFRKAGCMARATIVNVNTVPRPLERAHSESNEPHLAQSSRGMCRNAPQRVQRWKRNSPRAHQS